MERVVNYDDTCSRGIIFNDKLSWLNTRAQLHTRNRGGGEGKMKFSNSFVDMWFRIHKSKYNKVNSPIYVRICVLMLIHNECELNECQTKKKKKKKRKAQNSRVVRNT